MAFKTKTVKEVTTPEVKVTKKEGFYKNIVGNGWEKSGEFGTFIPLQLKVSDLEKCEVDSYGCISLIVRGQKKNEKNGQDLMVVENESKGKKA